MGINLLPICSHCMPTSLLNDPWLLLPCQLHIIIIVACVCMCGCLCEAALCVCVYVCRGGGVGVCVCVCVCEACYSPVSDMSVCVI